MKKYAWLVAAGIGLALCCSPELWARGGRGGGGGGMRGGGGAARMGGGGGGMGGGMRGGMSSAGRTPSMSMPSASRPNFSAGRGSRPGGGGYGSFPGGGGSFNRPQGNRASLGNLPTPGSRPGTGIPSGGLNRPGFAGGGSTSRPGSGAGSRPGFGGRPTTGQLDDFLNIGGGGINRPSARPGGGSNRLPGGAANDFLHNLPRPFPGDGGLAGGTRPSTRPASRPGSGDLAGGGRPAARPNPLPGVLPGGGDSPGRPGGGENRPGPGDGNRPGRPGDGNWAHQPGYRPNWDQWNNWRGNHWTSINNNWNNHWHDNWHGCHDWYHGSWWNRCPGWHWHYGPNVNWWGWATWGSVTNWFPWGWSEPVYYNYGNNVYYQNDTVYYGDQPVATADEYANQAEQIATSIPANVEPAPEDWMPLGVFALSSAEESSSGVDPTLFLQLAVSKEGIISGTYQNTTANTVRVIEGMVDKQSQRAAWTVGGEERPIMETGIGNLTQDTAPALMHFADGTTQQWLLVRLDQPKDTPAGSGTTTAPATPPQ